MIRPCHLVIAVDRELHLALEVIAQVRSRFVISGEWTAYVAGLASRMPREQLMLVKFCGWPTCPA